MVERLSSPAVGAPLPAQPVAPAERLGDPRLEQFQRSLATMLGSRLPVTVLGRMNDGSFMTRVLDAPVRMMLPPGTQSGAQLTMTVLAASPQPTFGLGEASLQGTLLPLNANAASLAASVAAASVPFARMGGQPQTAELSPAARLLAQVLQGTGKEGTPALQRCGAAAAGNIERARPGAAGKAAAAHRRRQRPVL
ncbi:hypothetical protein [Massilia sp. Se16.2.3]|uniref:hypothetical protein n=1 Tax=Massilia sp. Se16.2.3 TaxID=2709303 RepID=UPI0016040C55|nr:hypothetical protein [Massilia sp. Se16.2.3]QNB00956.1 hypothetical protein G4G31_22655 [Massilia sp. Se16.2.3]